MDASEESRSEDEDENWRKEKRLPPEPRLWLGEYVEPVQCLCSCHWQLVGGKRKLPRRASKFWCAVQPGLHCSMCWYLICGLCSARGYCCDCAARLGTAKLDPEVEDALPLTALVKNSTAQASKSGPETGGSGPSEAASCPVEMMSGTRMPRQLVGGGLADRLARKRMADEMTDLAPLCDVKVKRGLEVERTPRAKKKGNAPCKTGERSKGT